jgi:hypothetical protein
LKVAFRQPLQACADYHRAGIGQPLQARRQPGGMANRRIIRMSFAGLNRTDHYLASVDADPRL